MPKEAISTMKLAAELRTAFIAEASCEDRPPSEITRELMRTCIAERRQARDCGDDLSRKVEANRIRHRLVYEIEGGNGLVAGLGPYRPAAAARALKARSR